MRTLDLVFLWHMHQPDYRDHGATGVGAGGTAAHQSTGDFVLPWVYLHAMKDYVDMAAHLERHPHIRCVVNFVPVLLDQIEDYARQFASGEFRDPLLRMLATPDLDRISDADRRLLLATCFRSNHVTMLAPFPQYKRLHDIYQLLVHENEIAYGYLSGTYFADLVTWYHLAWTGEDARRRNPMLASLMTKGQHFDYCDRQHLLADPAGEARDRVAEPVPALLLRHTTPRVEGDLERDGEEKERYGEGDGAGVHGYFRPGS